MARIAKYEVPADRITRGKSEPMGLLLLIHMVSQLPDAHLTRLVGDQSWTIRQIQVLDEIDRSGGESQNVIAVGTSIDRSTMSSLIGRMEARGLITRRRSRRDGRVFINRITDAGAAVLAEGRKRLEEVEAAILAPLSPDDRQRLLALLAALVGEEPAQRKEPNAPIWSSEDDVSRH